MKPEEFDALYIQNERALLEATILLRQLAAGVDGYAELATQEFRATAAQLSPEQLDTLSALLGDVLDACDPCIAVSDAAARYINALEEELFERMERKIGEA